MTTELRLDRNLAYRPTRGTPGVLYIDGIQECYTLEDPVRERWCPASQKWYWESKYKVKAQTAIPSGRYQVIVTFSNRFQRPLPLLLEVPDFDGIRIHNGGLITHTEGCILPGLRSGFDERVGHWLSGSKDFAFPQLFSKIQAALLRGPVWITVNNGRPS